jgi:hypothetical protein
VTHEAGERAVPAEQGVGRAVLDDSTPLENHDSICQPDGRQAVGNEEGGASKPYLLHRLREQPFALRVKVRDRLVEDEDRGVHD